MRHPLEALLAGVARGSPPPPDGTVTVLAPPLDGYAAVLGFTAHHVVVADIDAAWVHERLPHGELSAPLAPGFLAQLCERIHRVTGATSSVLVAGARGDLTGGDLAETDPAGSPWASRVSAGRTEIRTWRTDGGVMLLGRGLAGRWEVVVEVEPEARNQGLGRALFTAARALVPASAAVWAQVSPGNVSSLRAVLDAGYRPAGAEVLLVRP